MNQLVDAPSLWAPRFNSKPLGLMFRWGAESECWPWLGALAYNGYGRVTIKRRTYAAHRAIYTVIVGDIPDGLDLDHLCGTRSCVNPWHLEPVTHLENVRRGYWATKPTCPKGHPLVGDNLTTSGLKIGRRECRECHRQRSNLRNQRKRDERGPIPPKPLVTACHAGHDYTPENTYVRPDGWRECRICRASKGRNRKATT